jgi:hypothetical protein
MSESNKSKRKRDLNEELVESLLAGRPEPITQLCNEVLCLDNSFSTFLKGYRIETNNTLTQKKVFDFTSSQTLLRVDIEKRIVSVPAYHRILIAKGYDLDPPPLIEKIVQSTNLNVDRSALPSAENNNLRDSVSKIFVGKKGDRGYEGVPSGSSNKGPSTRK